MEGLKHNGCGVGVVRPNSPSPASALFTQQPTSWHGEAISSPFPSILLLLSFCRSLRLDFDIDDKHMPLAVAFDFTETQDAGAKKDATEALFSVVVACELVNGRSAMTGMWQLDHD